MKRRHSTQMLRISVDFYRTNKGSRFAKDSRYSRCTPKGRAARLALFALP
jgi:hypothetical protein